MNDVDTAHRRADALPEHKTYRDDGCHIHPHCLTCPLPACIYDSDVERRANTLGMTMRVQELRAEGLTLVQVARELGISPRTVLRHSGRAHA